MSTLRIVRVMILGSFVVLPTVVRAQTVVSGIVAGVVKDTSGAVLPGVTVEAASPARLSHPPVERGLTRALAGHDPRRRDHEFQ